MRFAIEDSTDVDRPKFHTTATLADAIRWADDNACPGLSRIVDLKHLKPIATLRIGWGVSRMDIVINQRVYGRLDDIAAKCVRDSVGPRFHHIIPDID